MYVHMGVCMYVCMYTYMCICIEMYEIVCSSCTIGYQITRWISFVLLAEIYVYRHSNICPDGDVNKRCQN